MNVVEKVAGDIVLKRPPYFVLVNCYSLFVVDNFVVNGGLKRCLLDVFCVETSIEDVELTQHIQNLDVCDRDHSHKKLVLFDCDGYVESLNFCTKSSCIS